MSLLRKWIPVIGIFLCGIVLSSTALDRAVPIRDLIWCAMTLVLVCATKETKIGKIHYIALGYWGLAVLSGLFAINKSEWLYWVLRISLMVSYLSVVELDKKLLSKAVIVLGHVFVLYFWYDFSKTGNFDICRGLMMQRNTWATAHFLVIPFCWYAFEKKFWQVPAMLIGSCMVLNICLLGSRSAMLAIPVCLCVVLYRKFNWKVLLFSFICIALVAVMKFDRITNTTSMKQRLAQWQPTINMIADKPLGVGVGNWWIEFPLYTHDIDYPGAHTVETFRFPHNDFLWVWSETGVGIVFYFGMFLVAMYMARSSEWILIGLLGCMTIAFWSCSRERTFPTLMLMTFLALAPLGKHVIVKPKFLLIPLLIALVVFGFRYRSSVYNRKLRDAETWPLAMEYAETGSSVFSRLTYTGLPYSWWLATGSMKEKEHDLSLKRFKQAYEQNPGNVHVINGMGIGCIIEGDGEEAKRYFRMAIGICPDFNDAIDNLARLR